MRPLVDFVHADGLPRTDRELAGASASVAVRTLSVDPSTGAESLVVDLPAGWTMPASVWPADLELLVLAGTVRAGETRVDRFGYVFAPAGTGLPGLAAPDGASVLVFTSASGGPVPVAGSEPACPGVVHLSDLDWEQPRTPGFPVGAARKTLRLDTESGQGFWVLGLLAHWSSPKREWHEFAEENYVLDGEVETTVGVMTTGAYLSHPAGPECTHGPMRSRRGALLVTRAVGPFATTYLPATAEHALTGPWP